MSEKIAFYFTETGDYAPRDNLPFVRRNNIAAIIKYQNQYLFLSWNQVNYENSLITGGIQEDEDMDFAVMREVKEETGYYDFKQITPIDCINISRFYVEHKNQNREAIYYPYLVELESLDQYEIDDSEKQEHTFFWVSEDSLNSVNLFKNHKKMLDRTLQYIKQ